MTGFSLSFWLMRHRLWLRIKRFWHTWRYVIGVGVMIGVIDLLVNAMLSTECVR